MSAAVAESFTFQRLTVTLRAPEKKKARVKPRMPSPLTSFPKPVLINVSTVAPDVVIIQQ
jgi:hypothetical protein